MLYIVFTYILLLLLFTLCTDIVLSQHYHDDYEDTNQEIMEMYQKFGSHLFATPDYESGARVANWDIQSGVNPEELGNYVEGDIVFPRNMSIARNGIISLTSKWPHGIIPYTIAGHFSQSDRQTLEWAFAEYARLTCIKFVPRVNEIDYIYVTNDREGCYSSIGRVGGPQKINLQSPGCVQRGTVIHELMHVVGFFHEHTRWDRNRYVTIDYRNIIPGHEINFERVKRKTTNTFNVEYDYRSIMHYSEAAFSRNGNPTIIAKVPGVTMGQRIHFSKKDVKKIRRMYKCARGRSYL